MLPQNDATINPGDIEATLAFLVSLDFVGRRFLEVNTTFYLYLCVEMRMHCSGGF